MRTPKTADDRAQHWDERYRTVGDGVSWYQSRAGMSLQLIADAEVRPQTSVIDIGGGASPLAAELVERGYGDVTVLDVSAAALKSAAVDTVQYVIADLLQWTPERRYGLWHDRAVFHFLTSRADRDRYRAALSAALEPGGTVVIGTFAADGPQYCSGLPVCRYSPDDLAAELRRTWARGGGREGLGPRFELTDTRPEQHTTPSGAVQPFTWVVARADV